MKLIILIIGLKLYYENLYYVNNICVRSRIIIWFQVQIVSFQCSPLSTPDGILGTFEDCASYQKDKNLDKFVSVVVLDEIGLAEDSSRMPLKVFWK